MPLPACRALVTTDTHPLRTGVGDYAAESSSTTQWSGSLLSGVAIQWAVELPQVITPLSAVAIPKSIRVP